MNIPSTAKPELKPWRISPAEREKIERLNATSEWLRRSNDDEQLHAYRGKYVAARECKIIAAADTMEELYKLLDDEQPGSYMIASFKGGRIRLVPHR